MIEQTAPCRSSRIAWKSGSAIVMVSDGQATSGGETDNRISAARDYIRQRGIPVFSVGVGDPVPPQNVAVVRLQGPTEVRKGSAIEMTAYLSNRNCAGQTVEIRRAAWPSSRRQTGSFEPVLMLRKRDAPSLKPTPKP